MFDYWKDRDYFDGLHIWDWKVESNAGGISDKDYTPQNKPAEDILTQYFTTASGISEINPVNNQTPLLIPNSVTANVGSMFYSDRTYTIQTLPDYLVGKSLLMTKNADKLVTTQDYLKFDLTAQATVFIAYDSRTTKLPDWLSGWEKSSEIINTSDVSFNLYRKYFEVGTVTLGGNAAPPMEGAQSNYFILATEEVFQSGEIIPEPVPQPVEQEPQPEEPPQQSQISGQIIIEYPANNSIMTGEKKIKIYMDSIDQNEYTATYEVDGLGQNDMKNGSSGIYKQAKINFDTWTWNGKGPYNIVIKAYDLLGNLIDTADLTLYIK